MVEALVEETLRDDEEDDCDALRPRDESAACGVKEAGVNDVPPGPEQRSGSLGAEVWGPEQRSGSLADEGGLREGAGAPVRRERRERGGVRRSRQRAKQRAASEGALADEDGSTADVRALGG